MADEDDTTVVETLWMTLVEVGLFTAPVAVVTTLAALFLTVQPLAVFLSECSGLTLALSISRVSRYDWVLDWPRPTAPVDQATSVVAYSGVCSVGVVLGSLVWSVGGWAPALLVGGLAPVWFLRHLRFVLQL